MFGKFSEEELLWIRDVLDQHGEYLADLLHDAIDSKRLKKTTDLEGSIDYRVVNYGINPALQVGFLEYGRLTEIAFHKKSRNTQSFLSGAVNALLIRERSQKLKKRKDTRWYAKNAYGSLNRLIGNLMNDFSLEERNRIKGILEARKTRRYELTG